MGAWGERAFDNDTACDWAYDLEERDDLSLVEEALAAVEAVGGDAYLNADVACEALAACEVLARLAGRPGDQNADTESVDDWVAAHADLAVAPALVARATTVIDRVLGERSELTELWDEGDGAPWRATVDDLRRRVTG
ncbi:MAG: DUF4259 domain-containing protein [Planctomycetota bacterium]|nr:DUF4259 domain-containing protein [Planctomycetota bacterium]